MSSPDRDAVIAAELQSIRDAVPAASVRAAVPGLVQLEIARSAHARLILQAHFPSTYPATALSVFLKSGTLPVSALKRLEQFADSAARERALDGLPAVLFVHERVARVVERNLLLLAFDDVRALRTRYATPANFSVRIDTRDAKGEVTVSVVCANYSTIGRFTVPPEYPAKECAFEIDSSDVPPSLRTIFAAMTRETGRKLIKPDPKKSAVVVPTLRPMVTFFVDELAGRYPREKCQMCSRRMLPEVSADISIPRPKPARIIRLYCSHLFHSGCLAKYLETPPFDEGKVCPSPGCGKRIYHQKFKTAGNVKLAEKRWAQKVGIASAKCCLFRSKLFLTFTCLLCFCSNDAASTSKRTERGGRVSGR